MNLCHTVVNSGNLTSEMRWSRMIVERDPVSGQFVERPDSLARKPLTVRLPKFMQAELTQVAEADNRTESEIVREAIGQWLEQRKLSGNQNV